MNYKNVTVAGCGVLGSQIAFQTAFKGFNVTIYDINDQAIAAGRVKIDNLAGVYASEIQHTEVDVGKAAKNLRYNKNLLPNLDGMLTERMNDEIKKAKSIPTSIKFTTDLGEAVADADLVIEAITENPKIKADFYTKLGKLAPAKTVFASNSSTMLPSQFAQYTGRPEKFLNLHFANEIWRNNTAEVMGHAGTSGQVYDDVVEFAEAIGMVPLKLKKEQPGYILNSILVPFLESAQSLLLHKVADVETIDMTWKLGTGARLGPFQILDIVGIQTAYNIVKNYAEVSGDPNSEHAKLAEMLKTEYLDKGHTGMAAGEGFYKYN